MDHVAFVVRLPPDEHELVVKERNKSGVPTNTLIRRLLLEKLRPKAKQRGRKPDETAA
ncbi:hypothetical protein [Paludisphaera soli]|uniref:hypothetical protein n=1 Tax=Paludisphaera soli TaxID=2712865 RepID=UPI0013EDF79A|nr:hypothetical protein [Paludisphaera soli]